MSSAADSSSHLRLTATLSALATVGAGAAMALQGSANGALGGILGSGVLAATCSFLTGLVILAVVVVSLPSARAGVARAWRLVRTGEVPWWMTLGGIAGCTVVLAQAFTVPLIGVAVFTMAYIAGQLVGALVVDNTELPPGARKRPTVGRLLGSAIVLAGVSLSAVHVLGQGVPLWAPVLPFVAGALTAAQQATNGRLKMMSRSAVAATFTSFLVGSVVLVIASAVTFLAGAGIAGLPELPGDWWVLIGGACGVIFIGVTTQTVAHLGVLLLSLMSLFGNLLGSLVIDLTFHTAKAAIGPMTFASMAVVLAGVVVTSLRPRPTRY